MQEEAKLIFKICVLHGISIEPEWVPRSSNEQADNLSRIVDFDDWFVSPHIFRLLDLTWGSHSIDRFADEHNHLLPRFDSRFWNPVVKPWTPLPGRGASITTGFVRYLTLFRGC